MKLRVILEPQKEGGYAVFVPALPGCISEGDTKKEALENIRDAIKAYLVTLNRKTQRIKARHRKDVVQEVLV